MLVNSLTVWPPLVGFFYLNSPEIFLSFSLSGVPENNLVVAKRIDHYKHSTTISLITEFWLSESKIKRLCCPTYFACCSSTVRHLSHLEGIKFLFANFDHEVE